MIAKNRAFLADFIDSEIYLIKEDTPDYSTPTNTDIKANEVKEPKIIYTGDNSEGIMLENILASVNLDLSKVALIRKNEEFLTAVDHISSIEFSQLISFGVATGKSIFLDIQEKYSPTTIENRTVVMADNLSELGENKDLKRSLWNCLKEVFA